MSLPRRLIRLGHVASMALSMTNILYGFCIDEANISDKLKRSGSKAMMFAAILMPLVCILSALNIFFKNFFFIPALTFTYATVVIAWGYLKKESK